MGILDKIKDNIKEAMKIANALNLSIDYIFLTKSYQIGKNE